jgi:hypothetical protein
MSESSHDPVVLTNVENETQAALIMAALEDAGVKAESTGGLTSGLRAEAPGDVHILVRPEDAKKAAEVLADLESHRKAIEEDADVEGDGDAD